MKKQVIALLTAAMMVGAMAGCGAGGSDTTTAADTTAAETTTAGDTAADTDTEAEAEDGAETTAAIGGEGKVLVMATNAEFPPYEYHDGGDIVGIDVEVAEAIAGKLGMTLEVEDIAFDSIIPELESGKADIGVAGMTVNEDRLKNVDFTDPYTTASQVIIVKEDSEIAGPDDLKGKYIGVQLGTTGDIYASDYEADGSTIERYNKGFEAVQAMQQGKIDAVVIDQEPAKVFVSQNEGIKILDEALTVEEYAIAVKKGNTELLDQVNGALAELKESGELQAIIDKYISAE
ncbi:MAG: basic amino acid ABC transporter substrate-binding protein [Hungatella sp.]|nr:basic amino acid ABC transporter substrate-binding protein [Hungatella sp.]